MLDIADGPGKMRKEVMRQYFERMVNDTPALKANTPLEVMVIDGEFNRYIDPDTDTMWLGFALGMRCAHRVSDAT